MKKDILKVNLKKKARQVIRRVYMPRKYASLKGKMNLNSITFGKEEHPSFLM